MYHPNLFGNRSSSTCLTDEGIANENDDHTASSNNNETYNNFVWGYGWQKQATNDLEASILPTDDDDDDHDASEAVDDEASNVEMPNTLLQSSNNHSSVPGTGTNNSILSSSYNAIIPSQQRNYRFASTKWMNHYYALFWIILLLPVPLSRIHLHDHSPMQILLGSLVGFLLGCTWYFCMIRGRIIILLRRWSSRRGGGDNKNRGIAYLLVNSQCGKWIGLNL